MTLAPFFEASLIMKLHMIAALPAILVGPFVLFRQRRDRWHKGLGYLWLAAMVGLAVTGLFIPSTVAVLGYFGPLHLFSLLTLFSVAAGLRYAFIGNIPAHEATLRALWAGGIGGAGLMQFLPGRTVHLMFFGAPSNAGYLVIGLGAAALAWLLWRLPARAGGRVSRNA